MRSHLNSCFALSEMCAEALGICRLGQRLRLYLLFAHYLCILIACWHALQVCHSLRETQKRQNSCTEGGQPAERVQQRTGESTGCPASESSTAGTLFLIAQESPKEAGHAASVHCIALRQHCIMRGIIWQNAVPSCIPHSYGFMSWHVHLSMCILRELGQACKRELTQNPLASVLQQSAGRYGSWQSH